LRGVGVGQAGEPQGGCDGERSELHARLTRADSKR
jgi:hypothetical protein